MQNYTTTNPKTRGLENTPEKRERFWQEIKYFQQKWNTWLEKGDPFYNPNLTLEREDFDLNFSHTNN